MHNVKADEMAQWLKVLDAVSEDPSSVPSVYQTAHNILELQHLWTFFWPV